MSTKGLRAVTAKTLRGYYSYREAERGLERARQMDPQSRNEWNRTQAQVVEAWERVLAAYTEADLDDEGHGQGRLPL